jgi:DNA-binding helix-hairpin-helix protein with protein kinase domain
MSWLDESGNPIRLGKRLTTPGGEGVIYELPSDPSKVAKIYHQTPSPQKVTKLKYLRSLASPNLIEVAAWPTSLLFDANHRQAVGGFIMPLVKGKEIHRLYGPHDRYVEFPSAAWDFLIHVAKNSAAAFETLHGQGVVMADVNEKNLLVTSCGYARLIDCDSYQFSHPSGVFHCDVGVPLWTPPELQGRDFRGLMRTKNHDRFGLAVLIFQLLFMGRHPFAGVPDRPEQFEIEKAIGHFLFAFSPKTRQLGIRPPPHALSLGVLPESLTQLFERAFLRGSERDSARPSGRDWFQALDFLSKNLRSCSRDPGHKYPSHLAKCPWCEIYDTGGPNFFISVVIHVTPQFGAANVGAYWTAIQQVSLRPLAAKEPASFAAPKVAGTPLPTGISKKRLTFFLGCIIIVASVPLFWVVGWPAVIGIFIGWGVVVDGPESTAYAGEARRRRQASELAKTEIERSVADAKRIVSDYQQQFARKKAELQAAYNRYLRLDQEKREELQKLEAKKHQLQLNEFLDRILIRDYDIPEVKAKRKQALQAYGIESAFDVSYSMSVPGFGPHLVSVLLNWRRKCEARFRFNPAGPLPQKELHELNLRMSDLRRSLEIDLRSGPQSLNEVGVTAERQLRELETRTLDLVRKKIQAEADLVVCS